RRRRQRRGDRALRPRGRRRPRLHRRRRVPRADRGQGAAGRGGLEVSRVPFIAGNWKMHKTQAETREFLANVRPRDGVDVAICAPFTSLAAAREAADGIGVYAQNMHESATGAFTGEVSAPMLTELGVDGVVLGHSERRQHFAETDQALRAKLPAALAAGLLPILCVGETEKERETGETEPKLRHQVQEDLQSV